MKAMTKLIPIICLFVIIGGSLFYSCSQEKKEETAIVLPLDAALSQAGENRVELEKVLHRYQSNPSDSLKYRAACFLIENMPSYTYYKGKLLEQYLTFFTLLQEARSKKVYPQAMVDSIRRMYGPFSLDSLQYCKDVLIVDSAYLCNNIDWAFKVWQEQPWGKNVSFADFCEYILPYRIGDETLSYWREDIYRKYNPLLDSLRASTVLDIEDPLVAARCLCDSLRKRSRFFTTTVPQGLPHVGPEIAQSVSGSCRELSDYVVYVCRALGIPCAIDFMPLHGGGNDGHQWVSFTDKYGTLYFQEYPDKIKEVRKDKMCGASKIKVYRNTFSLNRAMQAEMQRLDTAVVPFFRDPHIVDVTADYAKTYKKKLEIPASMLYSGKPHSRIAYLCGSSRMDWEPVAWAEFDGEHLAFNDVQIEPVMRIATYERGRLRYWTDPFEMTVSGEFHVFAPSDSVQDVTLFDNSILENIRIGRKDATDEEVIAAAKFANVDKFAEKLPDGWNTNIGENGCELSGGERQRISIARAFLKDAPIILLDEATASLDVENETAIQEALSRLIKNKTVLIIAHRMRTVSGADKIVVLKDGAVAEQGSPAQLLQEGGIFAHMVQLQTESQSWTLAKA